MGKIGFGQRANTTCASGVECLAMVPVRDNVKEINAADIEHAGSLITGGLLLLNGFRKGGIVGTIYKLAGVGLIYRGQQGYRRLYDFLGVELPARPTGVGKQNVRVEASIVVNRPVQEIYRIWRNLENLPVFMDNLVSVHEIDDKRSLWVAKGPLGTVIKWDAEIVNDRENELIAWQSLEGSGVDNAGTVRFEEADGGCRVNVVLRYDPPADLAGAYVAKFMRSDPQTQIDHDLQKFKAIMELGGAQAESQGQAQPKSKGAKPAGAPAQSQPADQQAGEPVAKSGAESPQAEVL